MKTSSFNRFLLLGLAALSATAHAAVRNWDASDGTDWNLDNTSWTGTKWDNTTSDQAVFGATGAGTVNLTTSITANKLTFSTGGYTISGDTLTLSGATPAILNTAGANAINSNITLGAACTFTNSDSANTLTLGGTVAKGGNALTITGAGTVVLTGGLTGTGGLFMNGGNATYSATGGTTSDFRIGNSSTSATSFTMGGGDMTVTNFIYFSYGTASTGTLTQTGGTLNLNGIRGANTSGGNTTVSLSGGILNSLTDAFMLTQRGNTTMTVSGTANATITQITMTGWAGSGSSVVNLDGGTLTTNGFWETNASSLAPANNNNYTTTVNFNGGLLKARSATQAANFLTLVDNVNIKDGGALIDTNSYNVTIGKSLLNFAGATTAGLTKSGGGILTLSGTGSTYTGATEVNGGTLAVSGSLTGGGAVTAKTGGIFAIGTAGTVALSDITVKDTGTLRVDATGKILKSVTVENGGILSLPAETGATTTVTNALTLTGTPSFTVKPVFAGLPTTGTFDLLTPGSISGTAATITTDLGIYAGTRAYIGNTALTDGKLVLTMTVGGSAANLTWNNAAGTGNWSATTPADANFKNGGLDDMFYNQDTVTFDGTVAGSVTLVGTLNPAAVDVTSSAGDYTFVGTGSISGPTALNKSGTSALILENANSYTGGTNLLDGTLTLGHLDAIGATGSINFGGGTLQYTAANTTDYSPHLGTSGQQFKVDTNGQSVTWGTALATGSGTLTKTGEGTLKLTAAPKHGGGTIVNGGTLELNGSIVTYGGGSIEINNSATFKTSGNRYDFNGVTFTFGNTGGGSIQATNDTLYGGFVQLTAGNTFVTTGGTQNQFIGNGGITYNLNSFIATFDVAPGTDEVSDLKVSSGLWNTGGISKTGTGRLELASTHTYSGTTTVNNGKLLVTGSLTGGTAVTVNVDGTFDITGSITLKPTTNGVVNAITGTGTANLNGGLSIDLGGADNTPNNAWLLVDAPNLTETYGEFFYVSGGFAEAVEGSGIWTKNDGIRIWTFTEATGVLGVVSAGYTAWADSFDGLTDKTPEGDPDADGIKNLVEYVIGGDPRFSSTEFLPKQKFEGANLVLTYKRSDASESDTTQTGQWSVNLTDWTPVAPELVSENGTNPDDMRIVIPMSNAVNGRIFGRLHVTKP